MFTGAYPNNDLRRGDSQLRLQRETDDRWITVADNGDWSTMFRWRRSRRHEFPVTVTWAVPRDALAGRYRLRNDGNARGADGQVVAFCGTTEPSEIVCNPALPGGATSTGD